MTESETEARAVILVLWVEDHRNLRRFFTEYFNKPNSGIEMVACDSLHKFYAELGSERRYDVVLVDLSLSGFEPGPDGRTPNGVDLIDVVYDQQPQAKVAVFTDFGNNPNDGLLAAASAKSPTGYLYKQDDADVIASCIRELHKGTQLVVVSPGIAESVRQLIMPRAGAQAVWTLLPRAEDDTRMELRKLLVQIAQSTSPDLSSFLTSIHLGQKQWSRRLEKLCNAYVAAGEFDGETPMTFEWVRRWAQANNFNLR